MTLRIVAFVLMGIGIFLALGHIYAMVGAVIGASLAR